MEREEGNDDAGRKGRRRIKSFLKRSVGGGNVDGKRGSGLGSFHSVYREAFSLTLSLFPTSAKKKYKQ